MKITEILELENLSLVEPSFSDLLYQEMDELMFQNPGKDGKILVDEDENPVLFAKEDDDGTWTGCFTLFRKPSLPLIDLFEQFEWDMYQETTMTILDAVRDYYSTILCNSVLAGPDDLNPARVRSIDSLIQKTIGTDSGEACLDCCCGTGVGSMVMEQHAMHPIAYDNDESLLVRGITSGRLRPERTMWIDGRQISQFLIEPVSFTCGFMVGELHSFNSHIWQEIITAASKVSERVLFTTGTEPEIIQVKNWVMSTGKKVEIFESDFDPIYDRWVCYSD
jgi:hypothetical protein